MKEEDYIVLNDYVNKYLDKSITKFNNLELRQVIHSFLLSLLSLVKQSSNMFSCEKGNLKDVLDIFFKLSCKNNSFQCINNSEFDINNHPWKKPLEPCVGCLLVYVYNEQQLNSLLQIVEKINMPILLLSEFDISEDIEFTNSVMSICFEFSEVKFISDINFEIKYPLLFHYVNTLTIIFELIKPKAFICLENIHYQEKLIEIIAEKYQVPSFKISSLF